MTTPPLALEPPGGAKVSTRSNPLLETINPRPWHTPPTFGPLLRSAIPAYPDEVGPLHWRRERTLMIGLRGKPYFTRREVVAVVKWKVTTFTRRAIQYVGQNDHSSVRGATREAFQSALPEE